MEIRWEDICKLKTGAVVTDILQDLWVIPSERRRDSLLGGVLPTITLMTTFWLFLFHLASVIPRTESHIARKYILETIFMLALDLVMLLLVTMFYINGDDFRLIFAHLSDISKFGTPKSVPKLDGRMSALMTFTYWAGALVAVLAGIIAAFQTKDCEESNRLLQHRDYCRSSVMFWLPFDVDFFPISLLYALGQIYLLRCFFVIFMVIGFSQLLCMEFLTVRLAHLNEMVSRVVFVGRGGRNLQLKVCIDYYKHIKELHSMYFDSIGKMMIMARMFFGALVCLCIVTLILAPQYKTIVMSLFLVTGFVLQQHIGQRIIDKSEILADTMYNLNWYEASSADKKDFLIFFMETQTPLRYQFNIFGSCSHDEIKEMFKSMYFFLNIVINFKILSV